jgi:hypothetical protein
MSSNSLSLTSPSDAVSDSQRISRRMVKSRRYSAPRFRVARLGNGRRIENATIEEKYERPGDHGPSALLSLSPYVWSSTLAVGPFFFPERMPFSMADVEECISDLRIASLLAARRTKPGRPDSILSPLVTRITANPSFRCSTC